MWGSTNDSLVTPSPPAPKTPPINSKQLSRFDFSLYASAATAQYTQNIAKRKQSQLAAAQQQQQQQQNRTNARSSRNRHSNSRNSTSSSTTNTTKTLFGETIHSKTENILVHEDGYI